MRLVGDEKSELKAVRGIDFCRFSKLCSGDAIASGADEKSQPPALMAPHENDNKMSLVVSLYYLAP